MEHKNIANKEKKLQKKTTTKKKQKKNKKKNKNNKTNPTTKTNKQKISEMARCGEVYAKNASFNTEQNGTSKNNSKQTGQPYSGRQQC